jgi:hypothetical protein
MRQTIKKYKIKLNHVIKTSKKAYYEKQFVKYKNDTKKTWQTINEVLNRNKTRKNLPDTLYKRVQITMLRIPRKLLTNLTNIS